MLSPIESFVRGSIDVRENGLEVLRPQLQPRSQARAERAAAGALEQQRAIGVGIDERHVADRVGAARDAGVDEARRDLGCR